MSGLAEETSSVTCAHLVLWYNQPSALCYVFFLKELSSALFSCAEIVGEALGGKYKAAFARWVQQELKSDKTDTKILVKYYHFVYLKISCNVDI